MKNTAYRWILILGAVLCLASCGGLRPERVPDSGNGAALTPPEVVVLRGILTNLAASGKPMTPQQVQTLAAMAGASNIYGSTSLTGGAYGSMDSIDGTSLATSDLCFTGNSTDFYVHYLDASSGAAESSPDVIAPDTNAGNKRWILIFHGNASMFALTSLANAKYIVQQADGTLTNEQALGALATGILKNTTTTGVLSIAVAGTDYLAPSGSGANLTDIPLDSDFGSNGLMERTGAGTYGIATAGTDYVAPGGALGTPSSGTLTNCSFPTLNQNTTGSAASLSISGQTGLMTVTGLASTNRAKTVRDAADTILELGGSYTPTGTWNWSTASVTWPTFNQSTTGSSNSVKSNATTGLMQITGPGAGTTRVMTIPDANATLLYSGGALGTPSSGTLTNCTGYPASSESASGIVELATNAETVTGTDTARATTPANITAKMAAPGAIGGTTPAAGNFTTLGASGVMSVTDTTEATSTTAASLKTAGGLAVAKKMYIGDNIVMANAKGIDFSATSDSSGTMSSELFADYEEGIYNPTLTCSVSGSYTLDSDEDTLSYTRIGRFVYVTGSIEITGETSPSGNLKLLLPFQAVSLAESADFYVKGAYFLDHGGTLSGVVMARIGWGDTYCSFMVISDAGAASMVTDSSVDSAFRIYITIMYQAV